jgi:hypothetical protein
LYGSAFHPKREMAPNLKQLLPLREKQGDEESSWGENNSWHCPASAKAMRTTNPIRAIVDPIVASGKTDQHEKTFISLAVSSVRRGKKQSQLRLTD